MSGCVQWWPARTATPSQSSTCATSCGWTPSTFSETIPARRSGGGPYVVIQGSSPRRPSVYSTSSRSCCSIASSPASEHVVDRPRRSPTASAIAGVPASNLYGSSFQVVRSIETERIISPPRLNGDIASSSSRRPQSAPIPLGPHILCEEIARNSQSSAWTSIGRCGAACAASTTMIAPRSCAHAARSLHGIDRAERVRHEVRRDDLHGSRRARSRRARRAEARPTRRSGSP